MLLLNGNEDEARSLNKGLGRDRRAAAKDTYELEFDCPESKLKGVRVAIIAGEDAWRCDYFAAKIVKKDDSFTQVFLFKVDDWFSANKKEGFQFYDAKFERLVFKYPAPP